MEPAVPFALLGVVQLLALAGWLGLAAAALFPRLWRPATPVFVAGALMLAVAEGFTVADFGAASSRLIPVLRAVGFALLALGLAAGVPQPRTLRAAPSVAPAGVLGVVAPLGAQVAAAVASGIAGMVAAAAALRGGTSRGERRDPQLGWLLAGALGLAAAAALVGAGARTSSTMATLELALRAASSLMVFAACGWLARGSVLAKVVVAILVGVVVMAAGAVGVVGTSVADAVTGQQAAASLKAAVGERLAIQATAGQALDQAGLVNICVQKASASGCGALLQTLAVQPAYFAAVIDRRHAAQLIVDVHDRVGPAGTLALRVLAAEPAVTQALLPTGVCATAVALLPTEPPALTAIGITPGPNGCTPSKAGGVYAGVYAIRFTDADAATIRSQIAYDVTFLADGQVLATDLPGDQRPAILAAAATLGSHALPAGGVTVLGQGSAPTVSFVPLLDGGPDDTQVGVLAVSQPAAQLIAPERSVLRRLFLTSVLVLLAAAAFAFLLGRRVVDPVRKLTLAARQVRRGDLEVTSGVAGRDEVGALSRAFDAMTASLRGMTADLRSAAAAEAALRLRLQTVLDSMADGLVTADSAGRVSSLNPAAAALLDSEPAQVLDRPLLEVVDVRDAAGAPLLQAGADSLEADGALHRADGRPVPVRVAVTPLVGAVGEQPGVLVVLRDTTRDREVERMKTEFLANVSHELRTPLTPIRGYSELLARRKGLAAKETAEFLGVIHSSSLRMQRVVDLLVDVAALEAGRIEPVRRPVRVGAFADECLARWRARWPERAADFRRRIAAGLPEVDIDPGWIGKALDELADNAVKYTPDRTPITIVAADAGGRRVHIGVRDAGPGIALDTLPGLFADFSQADASETRRVGGLGLGLSFVRRLAEGFGLGYTASSEPGRGSEFALELPTVRPASRGRHRAPPRRRAVGTRGTR
ncbi:MAG TPA: ATP-binding protein [Mycobacteriales bacterium]|nr:ATP-binding protein [Mycobacteriales bacterium]